jgi:hypothetical protein
MALLGGRLDCFLLGHFAGEEIEVFQQEDTTFTNCLVF